MEGRRIDLHCHGGAGASFEGSEAEIRRALDFHEAHGTDALLASLPTLRLDRTEEALGRLREVAGRDPRLLGAHLEGPFLAPARAGAHDRDLLMNPTARNVDNVLRIGEGVVRYITVAPELPGAIAAIGRFVEAGWIVGVGHTDCDADLAREAFDAGATIVTHADNGMRKPGAAGGTPVDAAIADERVLIEVIADGVHVAPARIAELFAAAPGRILLVTDAMEAAGAPTGRYSIGGLPVEVTADAARIEGSDTLAGSLLTLDRALTVAADAGAGPDAARAAITSAPARALG